MATLICIDIDGTLADGTRRFKRAGHEPDRKRSHKAYELWVKKVMEDIENDPIIPGMVELVRSLHYGGGTEVCYTTSRKESSKSVTTSWLVYSGFPAAAQLYTRPLKDFSTSAVLKKKMIRKELKRYSKNYITSVIVIDDDPRGDIEVMCKREGYTFLKARSGGICGKG